MPITRSFRMDAWIPALLFAVGAGLAVFAGLTIFSWHAPEPVPMAAGFDRIPYDAAWAIAFASAALALHVVGATRSARLFALLTLALGGVRLAAWVVPDGIPLRPILANPWLPLADGSYNDMSTRTSSNSPTRWPWLSSTMQPSKLSAPTIGDRPSPARFTSTSGNRSGVRVLSLS